MANRRMRLYMRVGGIAGMAIFFCSYGATLSMFLKLKEKEGESPLARKRVTKSRKLGRFQSDEQRTLLPPDDPLLTSLEWDVSPIVVEEFRLIFFTLPKVGCTVFKQLFRRMTAAGLTDSWRLENCCGYLPWNPATNGLTYLSDFDVVTASKMLEDPSYVKAIFLREPVTRFLSAYLDKAVKNTHFLNKKCPGSLRKQNGVMSIEYFYEVAKQCDNAHWRPQTQRFPNPEYWKFINFIGYMETVKQDSERLLRHIGAWEQFGRSGWGEHGNQSIFEGSTGRQHATSASTKREIYIGQDLEELLRTDLYVEDYRHPAFLNYTK